MTLDAGDEVSVDAPAEAGSLAMGDTTADIVFTADTTLAVVGAMTATAGRVRGVGTLEAQGTFTKSGAGDLLVGESARLVLGGASTLSGGRLCLFQSRGRRDGGRAGDRRRPSTSRAARPRPRSAATPRSTHRS